jgi:hypothetical protein
MVLYVRNATILARHFWNHFPSKPVTMAIKSNAMQLSNQYTHLRYKYESEVYPCRCIYEHIILNRLDLFMNGLTVSEITSVCFGGRNSNCYNIHYKLQVNDGEIHEKKKSDVSSLDNLDLWHDLSDANKLRDIDKLIANGIEEKKIFCLRESDRDSDRS